MIGAQALAALDPDDLLAASRHVPESLDAYRLVRLAEWSMPRHRLDERFVELTMLIEGATDGAGGRRTAPERFDDLTEVLALLPDRALVVLGIPGAGKTTLLRHLEVQTARRGLADSQAPVPFLVPLAAYGASDDDAPPPPSAWLQQLWQRRYPQLPGIEALIDTGRALLLLDGLNEMQHRSPSELRAHVASWKRFLLRDLAGGGNRAVFTCRSLEYSAPLSTPEVRVPQVHVSSMSDAQMRVFLARHAPEHAERIWEMVVGSPQHDLLRTPFYLRLLAEQATRDGVVAPGQAALMTRFVRHALRREVTRERPELVMGTVLTERDLKRVAADRWRSAWELPERGTLFPSLSRLATRMQREFGQGESGQVRLLYDEALDLIGGDTPATVVDAGLAIGLLDEDRGQDEVMFVHQLMQEYFAARNWSRQPETEVLSSPWRASDMPPQEAMLAAGKGEPLPPLPVTGWEEVAVLGAEMSDDPEQLVRSVLPANLVLAARCASSAEVRSQLSAQLLADLRDELLTRSRDPVADLRHRVACGDVLGLLGDPRVEPLDGPLGPYVAPDLVPIPAGLYPIGDDEPLRWEDRTWTDHQPRHEVRIETFAIGRYGVTNAEWALFMAAGGYDDERWWPSGPAADWRAGRGTQAAARANNHRFRRLFQTSPQRIAEYQAHGNFDEETAERWRAWIAMPDDAFEAELRARWPDGRLTEPRFWRDMRLNQPNLPVVGVSWFEAVAYCHWLSAQGGTPVRLPTEVEWEAAARGVEGRRVPFGDTYDLTAANTSDARLFRPSPIGAFPSSDTPEGVADMMGNTWDWTSTARGTLDGTTSFPYPYDPSDGREDVALGPEVGRIARGGSWNGLIVGALPCNRNMRLPSFREDDIGFRLAADTA